ncbi:MAG TPA: acyl-CoA thioesterase, partial [Planctomycetota bacterium]|nr:acyl-CoA thioesterase [Planctomycetota bacterium]
RMGMRPSVSARTSRLGNSSFEMEYEVRAGAELLATGKAALVYVDAALKARPIPAAARRAIAAFEGIAAAPPG